MLWPHAATVLRMALVLTNHHQAEAEDVTQEAMLKAFRSLDQFTPGTDAKSWLLTILRHAWVDRIRSRKARHESASVEEMVVEPAAPELTAPEPAWEHPQDLLAQFGDRDVIAALNELPDDTRWTLLLVDVQGMDHAEAADVLGVAVGTVKSRTHRGRRQLRDVLVPRAAELGFVKRGESQPGRTEVNR